MNAFFVPVLNIKALEMEGEHLKCQVNKKLDVKVDLLEMEHYYRLSQMKKNRWQKQQLLERAFSLYQGSICLAGSQKQWIRELSWKVKRVYYRILEEALRGYYEMEEYYLLNHSATLSLERTPTNTIALAWKIFVYEELHMSQNAYDLLETANICLDKKNYEALLRRVEILKAENQI